MRLVAVDSKNEMKQQSKPVATLARESNANTIGGSNLHMYSSYRRLRLDLGTFLTCLVS